MILNTKHFGEIEVKEDKIIMFSDGLPGFEELNKFVILDPPDSEVPFQWMQSIENGDIAFVIINPFIFKADYYVELTKRMQESLEIEKEEDVMIYSIVVIPEDISKMTANLFAPLVINHRARKGKQIPLEGSPYHTKHFILEEMKQGQQCPSAILAAEETATAGEGR